VRTQLCVCGEAGAVGPNPGTLQNRVFVLNVCAHACSPIRKSA